MANYDAKCRTNYFRVKDPDAFRELLKRLSDIGIECQDDERGFVLLCDEGPWPQSMEDPDTGEDVDFDVVDFVSEHLPDGEVAIFQEAGGEKLCYLTGFSIAVNSKGERLSVDMNDIMRLVKETWGIKPTDCSY